ncbi:MAG: ABC transporter family substrate-binding protein [Rothia sp. (in: high G+C Gram-positive bacteria)]|uniref:ABC transporter family substrate-binding protein n=1 Tax=Rothia sp. (in: high G+C Gram-positive bacteria) TaxID=1885016 RepID=UPI0026DFCAC4|nr:ABC transporter family substrate-binding protein [Rothia sp. (in: high G+C Gram-positive bacteria)]MDO5750525.1 ABC transporter family substrate-binding protein [Rothia sp. (in: high G+C Gram-positive bacteria)]
MTHAITRRTALAGTATAGAAALLVGCAKKNNEETKNIADSSTDIKELYDINEQPVSALKQGGTLVLSITALGPDFNTWSASGNSSYTSTVMSPMRNASFWQTLPDGSEVLNKAYCESFEQKIEGSKEILTYKLNKQAVFNDGTPVDIDAMRTTWEVKRDEEGPWKIEGSELYGKIESIEAIDGDNFHVKVVCKEPAYPVQNLFSEIMHPSMRDPELFNNGYVNNPHPEYCSGPFKLESLNTGEKVMTLVPNEKWWGDKPVLDKIIFRQMEPQAARAALKNGEIDAVATGTAAGYNELKDTAGTVVRRGQYLFAGGLNINPKRVEDQKVRKAIFVGTDRENLGKIRFQGLPYKEKVSGSMVMMPFNKNYRYNFPVETKDVSQAQKILEGAGYTKNGDYYAKDGKNVKVSITIFGDTAVNNSMAQAFVQNMKEIGIECGIDQQPNSAFSKVVGNKDYDITFSGYSVSSDPTIGTKQFYYRKENDGVGTAEIDAMIEKMLTEPDDVKRAQLCNDIEKKHMDEVCTLGTSFNGPDYVIVKEKLANYGSFLYARNAQIPWVKIGWMK